MKTYNFKLFLYFSYLAVSLIVGQEVNQYQNPLDIPQKPGQFEQSILNSNKFQMNQGFTLSTSVGKGFSQTTGIYSNFSSFKLSERMKFNTGIHLIQNQNNLSYTNNPQMGVGLEFGLEYQLNPNSVFSFHIVNLNNSPVIYRNLSPFNVP